MANLPAERRGALVPVQIAHQLRADPMLPSLDVADLAELARIVAVAGSAERPYDDASVHMPTVRPWLIPDIANDALAAIQRVVANGTRAYISGAAAGAGVSTLLRTYKNIFNYAAQQSGASERVLYIRLTSRLSRPGRLLDTLAVALGLTLNASDRKVNAPASAFQTIFAQAARLRVRAIMIDQIDQVSDDIRELLTDFSAFTNPENCDQTIDAEPLLAAAHFGIVFGGRWRLETLQRRCSPLAREVEADAAVLRLASRADTVQAILEQTKVLRAKDCTNPAVFEALSQELARRTGGYPHRLNPAIRHVRRIRRLRNRARFTDKMVAMVLKYVPDRSDNTATTDSATAMNEPSKQGTRKDSKQARRSRVREREELAMKTARRHSTTVL